MLATQKATEWLIRNDIVQSNEREIIEFGIQEGKWMLLNIIVTIVLGIVFGVFWQGLVFLGLFILLRSYAGGYHADTRARCYIFSLSIISISFFLIKHLEWTRQGYLLAAILSGILIFLLAPVANESKSLDAIEIRVYKKKTRCVLLLDYIILSVSMLLQVESLVKTMDIMFITIAFLLTLGYIKQSHSKRFNNI